MNIYKIRRRSDGLFSTGGASPTFTSKGKAWNNIGHLKNHINMIGGYAYSYNDPRRINGVRNLYDDCDVVEFELVETEKEEYPVSQLIDRVEQAQHEMKAKRDAWYAAREAEKARKQYEELKERFEG